ncbi:MAG: transcriptional regulator, partial [Ktedonobacteraceae bacterium]|nr:transcriptional regulator [Ktedonobacteraceae bacterium]
TQIVQGRLLLAQGKAEAASSHFERLLSENMVRQHHYYVLEIQLLQVMAHVACKRDQQAQHSLRQVLTQAMDERFVRLFVSEGKPLIPLLRSLLPDLQKEQKLRAYALMILRAITRATRSSLSPMPTTDELLYEPLSAQEQRVLRLLATGWTNKAIANELVVSVNTVKDHIKHLYRKLGVSNRLEASEAAHRLKLL